MGGNVWIKFKIRLKKVWNRQGKREGRYSMELSLFIYGWLVVGTCCGDGMDDDGMEFYGMS
jgi:hypothetical protein